MAQPVVAQPSSIQHIGRTLTQSLNDLGQELHEKVDGTARLTIAEYQAKSKKYDLLSSIFNKHAEALNAAFPDAPEIQEEPPVEPPVQLVAAEPEDEDDVFSDASGPKKLPAAKPVLVQPEEDIFGPEKEVAKPAAIESEVDTASDMREKLKDIGAMFPKIHETSRPFWVLEKFKADFEILTKNALARKQAMAERGAVEVNMAATFETLKRGRSAPNKIAAAEERLGKVQEQIYAHQEKYDATIKQYRALLDQPMPQFPGTDAIARDFTKMKVYYFDVLINKLGESDPTLDELELDLEFNDQPLPPYLKAPPRNGDSTSRADLL